ncbi:uncharacterized protein [Oryza sativa Japonica Group]|jgi:large subunit ribosomal protein L17|uniref:Os05g0460700 protein n=2 Tax=Oryza sativa subsp. japonica TaxID=39947 RepID=A0A8J8XS46_ORYSJ|nr:uncharacterized protein LOC4339018 isoform X1 [Oryza sativa Japonica Group]KAB8099759.1 hypothetical protein EE612_029989 [Oryza sativa]EEE63988.1 hypothetical protein OsJ_18817 [Oryza sativa Japonica Group]KAF2931140.1 hypothetical protein DAI22_05g187600 [Oryza sativa Japonica Group]BAF17672.1 Os05g0460700 [Oryza sativa Japonica Group]BAG96015.1 unnamed protein product [Oryza sativa Japonica Group]|eukprot:NP_001055758.1 Os05g0460700 [Oryza sativa Japonica Group]
MGKFRKLGRHAAHRVSMLRTMVSQLVKHERIETTVAKAKEVRTKADQMVQLGKEGTLDAARRASAFVRGDNVVHKLFTELAYRYKDRAGGYTRLLRTRIRVGDAAPMAYIEHSKKKSSVSFTKSRIAEGLSTGRMNFERQNLQHHSHLSGSLLIHGPSHSPANNGQVLKSARTPEQKAYDKPERSLALFYVVERFF